MDSSWIPLLLSLYQLSISFFFFINDTIISLIINLKIIEINEHVYPFLTVSNNF